MKMSVHKYRKKTWNGSTFARVVFLSFPNTWLDKDKLEDMIPLISYLRPLGLNDKL